MATLTELQRSWLARLGGIVGGGGGSAPAAMSKEEVAFRAERVAVAQLADALRADPQAARIHSQLVDIGTHQGGALHHAAKGEWAEALRDLAVARAACVSARTLATGWATYATQLATANAKVNASSGVFGGTSVATAQGLIAAAAAKVAATPPNFAGAATDFAAVDAALRSELEGFAANRKVKMATLKAMSADVQIYLAADIASATALIAKMDAALAARDWSQMLMAALAADEVLSPALRFGQRRAGYETQRLTTAGDIASIRANAETQGRAAEVEALLAQADALAGHDKLKIEEGSRLLVEASRRCALWKRLVPTIAAHDSERKLADAEATALDKHTAAEGVKTEREAIAKLLQDAAASAAQARTVTDPMPAWTWALEAVRRARADLATAKKMADGLGPSAAAKKAAEDTPPKIAALQKALADLKTSAAAAAKAPDADQAAEALVRFENRADAAAKALAKNDPAGAAAPLQEAAKALAQAGRVQAQHGQFAASVGAVEDRLKALRAKPTAAAIKVRLDSVAKAIAGARASDQAHDGAAAIAALRKAGDAAAIAEQADRERAAYDVEAKRVGDRINAEVTGAAAKKAQLAALAAAAKTANSLAFAFADVALKKIDLQLDKAKLAAGASRKPADPNLAALASQMVDKGGAAAVDALIQAQPDGVDPKVIDALATGRYGVKFTIKGSAPGANEVKTMKRMCEVFSTIPDDIRGNVSITGVTHVDATGTVGGGYTPATGMIAMKGRRDEVHQKFGARQTQYDPKTRKDVSQLPKDIDPNCKAQNENKAVEYMGFAAAHEVGHGVDDERGFMAQHGKDADKGGWIDHGADIEPVAAAVGGDIAGKFPASTFNKSAESRKYVRDKITNRPTVRPSTASGSDDFKAYDAFDRWHATATSANVYRRQPDCEAITIGTRIYHEAYARQWVSYLAVARSKALTGYQFRAPGEWFAELYAGWKTGKLGPRHPALDWLTKL
ncbi:MAG: hypothetical protein ABI641_11935 [Caldimonas sp.]